MKNSYPARGPFDRVVLIYNPAAGGIGPNLARDMAGELGDRLPALPVLLQPTGFAGHARELARSEAAVGRPLLVSVSGDGGYNEVVNGVMEVPGSGAVCTVLAAGNANDHRRSTRRSPTIESITAGQVHRIDLLRLTLGEGAARQRLYAHSYIGFGLTPLMAIGIEKGRKGALTELVSVVRTSVGLKPFEIARADGARAVLDSLILANIADMAKYGKVSEAGEPGDGLFEVITLAHADRWRMALMVLRAATIGLGVQPSVSQYSFRTIDPVPFQIDGEIKTVDANTAVTVESAHRVLAVIS